jgi:hypothetical protein
MVDAPPGPESQLGYFKLPIDDLPSRTFREGLNPSGGFDTLSS